MPMTTEARRKKWAEDPEYKAKVKRSNSKYYESNKARVLKQNSKRYSDNRDEILCNRRVAHKKDPRRIMLEQAKSRAKRLGVPFLLKKEDITIPDTCPVLGISLRVSDGKSSDGSPSLDRVVPDLGYVRGNVEVMSHLANTIKSKGTSDQHRRIADWMDERKK